MARLRRWLTGASSPPGAAEAADGEREREALARDLARRLREARLQMLEWQADVETGRLRDRPEKRDPW